MRERGGEVGEGFAAKASLSPNKSLAGCAFGRSEIKGGDH